MKLVYNRSTKSFSVKTFSDWDQIRDLVNDQLPKGVTRVTKVRGSDNGKSYQVVPNYKGGKKGKPITIPINGKSALENYNKATGSKVENNLRKATKDQSTERKIKQLIDKIDSMIAKVPKALMDCPYGPLMFDVINRSEIKSLLEVDDELLDQAAKNSDGMVKEILMGLIGKEFDKPVTNDELVKAIKELQNPKSWYPERPSEGKLNQFIGEASKLLKSMGIDESISSSMDQSDLEWLSNYANNYYPIYDKIVDLRYQIKKLEREGSDDEILDSVYQKLNRLVRERDSGKSKLDALIDKYGRQRVMKIVEENDGYSN